MKLTALAFLLLLFSSGIQAQHASTFPKPTGFVNDFEDDFTPDQKKELDYAVKELLAKSLSIDSLAGLEMVVVTVTENMIGDEKDMSNYVKQLGNKWGVSAKGENKAIIIAYGKKIRKVTIVTGSGLDNILSPSFCHKIVDEKMTYEFRRGDYYNAILVAIKAIKEHLGVQ